MTNEKWDWEFRTSARDTFQSLDDHQQDRITSKLRIGPFRLACSCRHEERLLVVYSIEHRSGAYTADD